MILMLDNYDSFTYNLVQYIGELGETVEVYRNDQITLEEIETLAPSHIVISPGPCTPNEAGISVDVVEKFGSSIPILGVCLGHQCIGQAYGGEVIRARQVMHGKLSPIHHGSSPLFKGIEDGFTATRYHSLIVSSTTLPDCLDVTAWTQLDQGEFDEIMAFEHKSHPVCGVQFHPESIKTEWGHDLLQNFLTEYSA